MNPRWNSFLFQVKSEDESDFEDDEEDSEDEEGKEDVASWPDALLVSWRHCSVHIVSPSSPLQ